MALFDLAARENVDALALAIHRDRGLVINCEGDTANRPHRIFNSTFGVEIVLGQHIRFGAVLHVGQLAVLRG